MANVPVYDMNGKQVSETELNDAVFGITPNEGVMHACVVNYLANQRQGTQSTLTRTEVSGGGRKPYRQKGTGHARQGSIRAPQWYHGGVALGPKPRSYRYSLNKKVRRLAMLSAFSQKALDQSIVYPFLDLLSAIGQYLRGQQITISQSEFCRASLIGSERLSASGSSSVSLKTLLILCISLGN